ALALVEHSHSEACTSTVVRLRLPDRLGGGEIMAASVHLSNARHTDTGPGFIETGTDAEVVQTRMAAWQDAIIGGDFNATPWSWGLRRFDAVLGYERWTRALATWPAPAAKKEYPLLPSFEFLPIDHVLSTRNWRLIGVRRGPDLGSD